jgi:hypothetical protein
MVDKIGGQGAAPARIANLVCPAGEPAGST